MSFYPYLFQWCQWRVQTISCYCFWPCLTSPYFSDASEGSQPSPVTVSGHVWPLLISVMPVKGPNHLLLLFLAMSDLSLFQWCQWRAQTKSCYCFWPCLTSPYFSDASEGPKPNPVTVSGHVWPLLISVMPVKGPNPLLLLFLAMSLFNIIYFSDASKGSKPSPVTVSGHVWPPLRPLGRW
jgi:hypothetical protein